MEYWGGLAGGEEAGGREGEGREGAGEGSGRREVGTGRVFIGTGRGVLGWVGGGVESGAGWGISIASVSMNQIQDHQS